MLCSGVKSAFISMSLKDPHDCFHGKKGRSEENNMASELVEMRNHLGASDLSMTQQSL